MIGEDVQIPRGFDEPGTIGANMYHYWVWNLVSNEIWRVPSCVTSGTNYVSMHGKYFAYLSVGYGIHVSDIVLHASRQSY